MFIILFLLFVLIPVVELSVLIEVGDSIGALSTVALVFLTAIVGVSLVRSQGLSTMMQVQQKLARGEAPGKEIVEGMMLAAAGVLLLIPGFVTDFIGLLLLTPFTRSPIAGFLFKRMQLKVKTRGAGFGAHFNGQQGPGAGRSPFDAGNVFDADFERKDEPTPRSHHIETNVVDPSRAEKDITPEQNPKANTEKSAEDNAEESTTDSAKADQPKAPNP
ncbi:FxsA cytoplasmic membrane protein [Shewanella denitrificans OS217]|jgi:UPF0716 protein FxsA|uniref:FxsA cytoplasmic membrane protein n=1 Tax=Shewanella denitrificans (strain OS217 / ATCC BAA-1090 / DSM 15013) TaxID=318161 RepID=Q12S65_SHEDO|nr:FxsA family protein [Shewanella denitrificans]ABE53711.1 FxsA cytoplasmic membrane protein [Shewanella denitrificans OS217]